jgi:hypothetical protein
MYNEEELSNINDLVEFLNKNNEYVNIPPNSSKILRFIPSKEMKEVEKPYNGKPVKKIQFKVIEENSDNKEKFFYVGKRSARLIAKKLSSGHTLLKVERTGSGIDTLYIPTPVTST